MSTTTAIAKKIIGRFTKKKKPTPNIGALSEDVKKAQKQLPTKLKMSKEGLLKQKVKQAEKEKALRELGNRIKEIEKDLKRKDMDAGLRKILTKDLAILKKKRKTGNYSKGGLATKKYVNPVTFVDNLKNKKK